MMATLLFPPASPLTSQFSALLVVLVTVAAKVCVPPAWTLAAAGVTDTSIGAGRGGGGVGAGGDGGCVEVAPLDGPDPLPPHPASCSNPATSPAITRRLSVFPPGSVI